MLTSNIDTKIFMNRRKRVEATETATVPWMETGRLQFEESQYLNKDHSLS